MSKTLLITDDALIMRELIKDAAERGGWTVVGQATNGREASEKYEACRADVVTMDLVMPESDGRDGIRRIREIDPEARVVIVSALDQRTVLADAIALGASDFVIKPFNDEALLKTLDAVCAQS